MFLAIVAEVNDTSDPLKPKPMTVIPIKTGTLHTEILSRVKLPFLSTRGEVKKALIQALKDLETETKTRTNDLPLGFK